MLTGFTRLNRAPAPEELAAPPFGAAGAAAAPATAPAVAPVHVRKAESAMTQAERGTFTQVINALIANGFYAQHVLVHANMNHRMHSMSGPVGTQRFLAWHRVYLVKLEEEMRKVQSNAFIPYWDWTQDRNIPQWMQNFLPSNILLPNGQPLDAPPRTPGQDGQTLPTQQDIQQTSSAATFSSFTTALENNHNIVHDWVGGNMADIMISPADPLFWMHHAQIDRIWAQWHQNHQNQNPKLKGSARILDPWNDFHEVDTRDIAQLGYSY